MAETTSTNGLNLGNKQDLMLADFIVLVICALIVLGSLAVIVWQGITGQLLTLDGLDVTLICLTFLAIFGGNLAWSVHSGELWRLLGQLLKKQNPPSEQKPSAPA
jgi:hypothetical protein